MNKTLLFIPAVILAVSAFVFTRPQKAAMPSDLRDAVGEESREFNTTAPEFNKTGADFPEPKAQKAAYSAQDKENDAYKLEGILDPKAYQDTQNLHGAKNMAEKGQKGNFDRRPAPAAVAGKVRMSATFKDDSCLGVEEIIEGEIAMANEALNDPQFADCILDANIRMPLGQTNAQVLSSIRGLGNRKVIIKCFHGDEHATKPGCVTYGYVTTQYPNTVFLNSTAEETNRYIWRDDVVKIQNRSPALFEFGLSHPPPKYYGVLVHEVMHLLGYDHPDFTAPHYWETVPLVVPQCAAIPYKTKYDAQLQQLYDAEDAADKK